MRSSNTLALATAAAIVLATCAPSTGQEVMQSGSALQARLEAIDQAVADWRDSESIEAAHAAAETAANLVVGPDGPGYRDRDGNGEIGGETDAGLLPGEDGSPAGLAGPPAVNDCIASDVLGGTWSDPMAEWQEMITAIEQWRPDNNTMPTLASHPMRIVGWATFTLSSESLDLAHEYGGHAKLHVDVSVAALDC